MRVFYLLRSAALWLLEIVLVVIWIATLVKLAQEGETDDVFWAAVVLFLLTILYFAEGIELAVADLLDKQPDQIRDEKSRGVLKEIQGMRGFFFSQRQIFVVVIIAFMTLMTSYEWLYVPGVGKVDSFEAPFWFSLLFTTLTVLWFCQVTPKRLAVINSERFLAQSAFLWPVIKQLGKLGLLGPSDHIVALMERRSAYKHKRHLLPSRATHYDITTQLYGFSLDRLAVDISIRDDGSATITQKLLVLLVRGEHTNIHGRLETQSAFVNTPQIELFALHTGPLPEQFETIASELDAIFSGNDLGPENGFSDNLIDDWAYEVDTNSGAAIHQNGEEATWVIKNLRPLPESLWSQALSDDAYGRPFAALLYQVDAEVAPGAFAFSGNHHWQEYVQFPCRELSVRFRGAPQVELDMGVPHVEVSLHSLDTPLAEETERCRELVRSAMISGGARSVRIPYPVQGGIYRIHWELTSRLPKNSRSSVAARHKEPDVDVAPALAVGSGPTKFSLGTKKATVISTRRSMK